MEREEDISYFDWELQFKKSKVEKVESENSIKNLLNSLGIEKNKFKDFLKNWKSQNL